MKSLDETLNSMPEAQKEQTRLHVELEMAKRAMLGSDPPPVADRLDAVSDLLLLLVDKYRRIGRFLSAGTAMMVLSTLAMVYTTYANYRLQASMKAMQADQELLLTQQRETRRAISETRDKVLETSRAATETKEAVSQAVDSVPKVEIDAKTGRAQVVVPVSHGDEKKSDKKADKADLDTRIEFRRP